MSCDKCGKQVPNDQKAMMLHLSREHHENLVKYTPGPNRTLNQYFECEVCEFKGRSKPSLLKHMAMLHSMPIKKRKLPEKKVKCDICGHMLINLKGLDLHKKRMHIVKENILSKQLERTDSVRSSKSVKSVASPPPKKHDKDPKSKMGPIWPKKQETPIRKWEMTPMSKENEMDTDQAHEKGMEIAEDLRLAKMLVVTLKRENDQLRHINKTQIENNSQTKKNTFNLNT